MTPPLLVLTDRAQARRPLLDVLSAAVAGGARYVVLREKDLPRDERAALAVAIRAVLAPVGGRLVAAGPDPLDGDAVHLAAADPLVDAALVGRSCHREADLHRLSTEDYATLSPVFPSPSKPGYGPPLGVDGLARLCARSPVPVFALGGITSTDRAAAAVSASAYDRAAACVAAGAYGVAVMGEVMRATDPAETVGGLLAAISDVGATGSVVLRRGSAIHGGEVRR